MTDTPTVLASILVEAVLSAISGVIVFVVSLAWVRGVDAPLRAAVAFALLLRVVLHPRSSARCQRLLRPFGAHAIDPLPFPTMLGAARLLLRHLADRRPRALFMIRSVGANPGLSTVAVPRRTRRSARSSPCSRSSRRRGSACARRDVRAPDRGHERGTALGATILNRLAITVVEVVLFGVGVLGWRTARRRAETAEGPA